MSRFRNIQDLSIAEYGIRMFIAVILFACVIFLLRPWVVAGYELFQAAARPFAEHASQEAADAAAIERRTTEFRQVFTDAHLRAIAGDRLRAIDLDMALKRACDTLATRVDCRALDAAGVPDRWRQIRTQAELERLMKGTP